MKTDREETLRTSAKLFLNSLYGKMANNTDSSFKAAHMNENGFVGFNTINFAIRAALANYYSVDKAGFIYADTDSIHYRHIGKDKTHEK